jgi:hypothetical protein
MAIFKNSTFGNIRKSIGDDVAYRSGGQNIVRKKPAQVNDANSFAQRKQRNAMKEVVNLFRAIGAQTKGNFPQRDAKHSAYNAFASKALKEAVVWSADEATIDLASLSVARGTLPMPQISAFADAGTGSASVTLVDLVDNVQLFPNDKLVITKIGNEGSAPSAPTKFDLGSALPTSISGFGSLVGEKVSIYAHNESENGAKVSDSIYLGAIVTA